MALRHEVFTKKCTFPILRESLILCDLVAEN